MTKRGVDTGCNDPADCGFEIERNREREKLFLFVEGSGEVVETGAGIDADGEIARVVVGDLVEAGHVKGDVVTRRRHTDFEFRAVAAGNESDSSERSEADNLANFSGRSGLGDSGGNHFIDGVPSADCRVSRDLRSADGGFEAGGEI